MEAVKDQFGFIVCAEREGSAFFRLTDVCYKEVRGKTLIYNIYVYIYIYIDNNSIICTMNIIYILDYVLYIYT